MKTISEYFSYDEKISNISEYFSHDEKISNISEYLLSKKHNRFIERPEFGCSVEELKEWFEKLGITKNEFFKHDGDPHYPQPGGITVMIGPAESLYPDTHWIAVSTTVNKFTQKVCIRTKVESFFQGYNEFTNDIDFDTALDIAEYMVKHRKEPIKLSDFKK